MLILDKWVENGNELGINKDIKYVVLKDIIDLECNKNFALVTKIVRESRKDTDLPVLSVAKSSLCPELQLEVERVSNKLFLLESLQTKLSNRKIFNHTVSTERILLSTLPDFVNLADITKSVSEDYILLGVLFSCDVGDVNFLELLRSLSNSVCIDDIVLYHIGRDYFVLKIPKDYFVEELKTTINLLINNSDLGKLEHNFILTDNICDILQENTNILKSDII